MAESVPIADRPAVLGADLSRGDSRGSPGVGDRGSLLATTMQTSVPAPTTFFRLPPHLEDCLAGVIAEGGLAGKGGSRRQPPK